MYRARRAFAQGAELARHQPISRLFRFVNAIASKLRRGMAEPLRLHYRFRLMSLAAEDAARETGPSTPKRSKLLTSVAWIFQNFGPLIVFIAFEHLVGLLAAIISGIVSGVVLVAWQIIRERKISPFTAFIAASVVGFGILDLHYQTGFFVKIEPALGNALTGLFFLGTVVVGKPIVIEFAEKAMGRALPTTAHPYLRNWTIVWGLFFFARAAIYVWMAYSLTIDQALAIRGIAGPLSFGGMFVIELVTRKLFFPNRNSAQTPEQNQGTS